MTLIPTAGETEDFAKRVLSVFVNDFNHRAGDVLGLQDLVQGFVSNGGRSTDVEIGLKHALSQGWIEMGDAGSRGVTFRLTEAGYAAA